MADRPVFIPQPEGHSLVQTEFVSFQWHPGQSISQKQKSIASLHGAAKTHTGLARLLEVSSKSPDALGVAASAFNLIIAGSRGRYPLENVFQAGKVFEGGVRFRDLLGKTPLEARRDPRLRESGRLVGFRSAGNEWPLEPATAFYDWLYVNAVARDQGLATGLAGCEGFTDIEFNPKRSVNCQAFSAALFVALFRSGLIDEALSGPERFLAIRRARVHDVTTESGRTPRLL